MACTRTPGIRIDRNGRRIIDKEHRGVGIYVRLGSIGQEHAEQRLAHEMAQVDLELLCKAHPRARFVDCAARYLAESRNKRSVDAAAWHVRLLTGYIGALEIEQIHDGTLARFVADRVASGVTATTINRSLEVVRTILNRHETRTVLRVANARELWIKDPAEVRQQTIGPRLQLVSP